jgi:hypothetical protein
VRLIPDGPDIPEDLLYEQEQGNVVFFCGAGVSCSAGLPGYRNLVCELYKELNTFRVREEETLFNKRQYDNLLWALEQRVSRECLNDALLAILKRYMRSATSGYHKDLLTLSTDSQGAIRLVTTNYDTLFEKVSKEDQWITKFQIYAAPALPVPKKNSWNGLVYLHGRLPEEEDDGRSLNRLVITSADYGHAYLEEGWATRFLLELFRNFTVCFIGYSLSDPIIRYITDALAVDWFWTDRMPTPYAFTSDENETGLWKERGITPINFNNEGNYSALRDTLAEWAKMYVGGVDYKIKKVEEVLTGAPSNAQPSEYQVTQIIWALAEPAGRPAMQFAEINPPASVWLPCFFDKQLRDRGYISFLSCPPDTQQIEYKGDSSFYQEHSALSNKQIRHFQHFSNNDPRLQYLIPWLLQHSHEEVVLRILFDHAFELNPTFQQMLRRALETGQVPGLSCSVRHVLLMIMRGRIKKQPRFQPNVDWFGQVTSNEELLAWQTWKHLLRQEGLTGYVRNKLYDFLAPKLLYASYFSDIIDNHPVFFYKAGWWEAFDVILDFPFLSELRLGNNKSDVQGNLHEALQELLAVFEQVLREALDLLKALKKADANSDGSIFALPSIEVHDAEFLKRPSYGWGDYILLLRDAWLALNHKDEKSAAQLALRWFEIPYPTFKRLALFAASRNPQISAEVWAQWLLSENGKWLWSLETRRETMRLFATRGADLTGQIKEDLETKVLEGPPDDTFSSSDKKCREIALRLKKLQVAGCALSRQAQAWLSDPKNSAKDIKLFDEQHEEFFLWLDVVDKTEPTEVLTTPKIWNRDYLLKCLEGVARGLPAPEIVRRFWPELCRKDPENVGAALLDTLARTQFAISNDLLDMIKTAFLIWASSGPRLGYRTWNCFQGSIRSFLMNSPNLTKELLPSIAIWAQRISTTVTPSDHEFIEFLSQLFALARDHSEAVGSRQLLQLDDALRTPIGALTQALFILCFPRHWRRGAGIPGDLQPLFSDIFKNSSADKRLQPARGVAAAWATKLCQLDPEWTKDYIVPLFSWSKSKDEASFIWQCYLNDNWLYETNVDEFYHPLSKANNDFYFPLFQAFWEDFFQTFKHIDSFNEESKKHLAWQLLEVAQHFIHSQVTIDTDNTFNELITDSLNIAETFYSLNSEILEFIISKLHNNLCQEKSPEDYFRVYIVPFWKKYWPKDIRLNSKITAANLAKIAIKSKDQFEEAFDLFKGWLIPLDPEYSQELLEMPEADIVARQFPAKVLHFLYKIVDTSQMRYPPRLKDLLEKIKKANSELEERIRYKRLADFCDRAMPYQPKLTFKVWRREDIYRF